MQVETNCPCGRKKPYAECCGIAHRNIANVKTAEDLMRSRYTAFTQANGDYLMLSHHTTTRELDRKQEIADWAWSVEWLRLEIISAFDGGSEDEEGTVEFRAHFKENGKEKYLYETSRFLKERGKWKYHGIVR